MNNQKTNSTVNVDFTYLPVINFALQQNKIKLIRDLIIENISDQTLQNITVKFQLEPELNSTISFTIDSIAPQTKVRPTNLNWDLSSLDFVNLTERLEARIDLTIESDGQVIFQQSYPVSMLAFDEWSGSQLVPEILASFVTPNHPALTPILKRTADILGEWTGNASLDAYQSKNVDRVYKQVAALYVALSEQQIIYSNGPASFESTGQRVRLADTILSQKLANCLDLSLLVASCLESMGLHPLVVLIKGHAFVGVWLIEEVFSDSVIDDYSILSKLMADGINELTLFEATCLCYQPQQTPFEAAVQKVKSYLNAKDFTFVLDICRCRLENIRPLPLRVFSEGQYAIQANEGTPSANTMDAKPEVINRYDLKIEDSTIELTKQMMWERKLLDLSLRNNLINLRITKNTLQLATADTSTLEDAFAQGSEFSILSKPPTLELGEPSFGIYEQIQFNESAKKLIETDLKQNRVRTLLSENDLEQSIKNLYRSSRLSLEENGSNTLFLAIGLLRWYETKSSERARYAPLILLPVEIIRKSAAKGYVLRSRDEDVMINITLLEMLRQNFNILIPSIDTIATDEFGVDVKLIYSIFRDAIKTQTRWDVVETSVLGLFSFSKFIMWNDIHNNSDKLIANPIVSSLVNGKIAWEVTEDEPIDLDLDINPSDVILPVSADSSQMLAVVDAVKGKSFILHGPPGTGKSQTITNLIANALYSGKRVLFVAEKMAALTVVQKRLEAIGLAPFCLELHSNKTKKSAILDQLRNSLEVTKKGLPQNFLKEAENISRVRSEIVKYMDDLHRQYPFGLSLYDAIVRYENIKEDELFSFDTKTIATLDRAKLEVWNDLIRTTISALNVSGQPANHPLKELELKDYSLHLKEDILNKMKLLKEILSELDRNMLKVTETFGDAFSLSEVEDIQIISNILSNLNTIPELSSELLNLPSLQSRIEALQEIADHGVARDKLKTNLLLSFKESFLTYNAKQGIQEWQDVSNRWAISKYFAVKKFLSNLNKFSNSNFVKADNVLTVLQELEKYQAEQSYIDSNAQDWSLWFGKYGKKQSEDWATIKQVLEQLKQLDDAILELTRDVEKSNKCKNAIGVLLSQGVGTFRKLNGPVMQEYVQTANSFASAYSALNQSVKLSDEISMSMDYALFKEKLNTWIDHMDSLKDWYQWQSASDALHQNGLSNVVDYIEKNALHEDRLSPAFQKSLYKAMIIHIVDSNKNLQLFDGRIFSDTIAYYRKMIDDFQNLTRQELVGRLADSLPNFTLEASQNSEVGILQKNIRNNGRGTSIRKLFDQIPVLLSRLCPCMLMSPISVAQYIDIDAEKFDLIVFDEASQMPTSESVGAIARGKSVVIVGDPKQMPPTSFFATTTKDEENMELEDLESILDDCLALSMPSRYLLWHYRSRHESLISFSNAEYYDNKLHTFPSPDNIVSKVSYVQVEGVYDKGKTRQNKYEAEAIVKEIERRLRDENLRNRSIGVVTFSIVQQMLIEDLLSDLFAANHDLEALATQSEEPIFVKNLENVQGDERDVILFSVCYGPDENGNVSMNFGPLNREGGERRLNVAVTRARYEMIIFATLKPEQIDLNRTSSLGVAGLKRFLEFAQSRHAINMQNKQVESISISNVIAEKLRQMGYKVDTNIGSSAYKIDLGIVDEDVPGTYKLGIVCDGFQLHNGETIRDREIVQPGVLKGLAWKIHRVWTLDWMEKPEKVIEGIVNALNGKEEIQEEKREIEEIQVNPIQEIPINTIEEINIEVIEDDKSEEIDNTAITDESRLSRREKIMALKQVYTENTLRNLNMDIQALMLPENRGTIIAMLQQIIKEESPISKNLLTKKLLTAWGIPKSSPKVTNYLDTLISSVNCYRTTSEENEFFWLSKEFYDSYNTFRTDSKRAVTDICPEEFANAMQCIMVDNLSLPIADLVKMTGMLMGFNRITANVDAVIRLGIPVAAEKGYIKISDDKAIEA